MTDEELEQELQSMIDGIEKLSDSEKPLSKAERRRKHILLLKKEALLRMKQAREKNDSSQELKSIMDYTILKSFGDRHPLLLHLARIRSKGHIF